MIETNLYPKRKLTGDPVFANERGKTIGILQPGYLPWIGFFEQISRSDIFVIYDDVQYDKGGWRNRNRIKTATGAQWLTVPVLLNKKSAPLINEVLINNTVNWQDKHIRSITQNYSKSLYFGEYSDALFSIINSSKKLLIDLDMELIRWFIRLLDIDTIITLSSDLNIEGLRSERLIRIINSLGGTRFYEGAAGKNYINTDDFKSVGIDLHFQNFVHKIYSQQHGEFISHLSIIDLLFNCGAEGFSILTRQNDGN